ncbi:hypothetical protein A2U01_0034641, partial [Trifolium medium]|nr:hypothetical protein [Trifolium medium]
HSLSDHQRETVRANIKFQGSKRLAVRAVAEREEARYSDAKQKVSGLTTRDSARRRDAFAKRETARDSDPMIS